MGKPGKSATTPVPIERKIRTRSVTLRKKSVDESLDSQIKPFFEQNNFPPREYPMNQTKPKFFPNHEDIDIYFASCFNSNIKTKEDAPQTFQKGSNTQKNHRQNKKPNIVLSKQEYFDEAFQSEVNSSLASIKEESVASKPNFHQESQSPESPIFGRKLMKNLRTPPNKLVDLKDFDQSEEIVRKNFIDQLEDVSKDVSSLSDNRPSPSSPINQIISNLECSSPVLKTEKRISKRRKTPENRKKRPFEDIFSRPEEIEFSFRRHMPNDEARRRAQILRLSTLRSLHMKYEKSQRSLMSLDNALKSLMNYYHLRELNTKVLGFRTNVYKLLKDEIDKMLEVMREKKDICVDVIQEKSKNPNEMIYYYDEKMGSDDV